MGTIPVIIIQFILILVNGFFSATEMAVVKLDKNKLRKEADEGNKTSKKLLKMCEKPERIFSTIQIVTNLIAIICSVIGAETLREPLGNKLASFITNKTLCNLISFMLVILPVSFAQIIFGELVPKRIAIQKPYSVARLTLRVISFVTLIFTPLILFLNGISSLTIKILRIKSSDKDTQVIEDEIKLMVDIGKENGEIEDSERNWIQNVFEFNDTIVREVMTPWRDVKFVTQSMSREEIISLVKETGVSRYPVCKDDLSDVIGVLNIKDFFLYPEKSIKNLMLKPNYVPETTLCDELFKKFQENRSNFAIVVDEYGSCSGIVTTEDLIEEIVGEVYDEYDKTNNLYTKLSDTSYRISGKLSVFELNEILGSNIEENDCYDTVGGLIYSKLDYVPSDGTKLEIVIDNLKFNVEKINDRRIIDIVVTKLEDIKKEEE